MAERRMFSKTVISSGRFLRMPPTSRLLYYDLGMAADDDGIVEAYTVLRSDGCTEDDLRVLIAKGFVRLLNEDMVAQIMDWHENNTIRMDRYHRSIYAALVECQPVGNQMATNRQPVDNQMETEVRLGKDRLDNSNKAFRPPTLQEVKAYCQSRNNGVNPEKWYAHYEAVGWKVGKNKIKDWKAAVRTWEQRDNNTVQVPVKTVSAQRYTQREYDEDDLKERLGVNDLFRGVAG